jgi:hypothetical protein
LGQSLTLKGRLGQSQLPKPVIPLGQGEAIPEHSADDAVLPPPQVIPGVVVQDPPHVVRVMQEVEQKRPEPERDHIAKLFSRLYLKSERVMGKGAEGAVG